MMQFAGQKVPLARQLQASAADTLNRIEWRLMNGPGKMPPSILSALNGTAVEQESDVQSYDSPEEFEAALAALKGGG